MHWQRSSHSTAATDPFRTKGGDIRPTPDRPDIYQRHGPGEILWDKSGPGHVTSKFRHISSLETFVHIYHRSLYTEMSRHMSNGQHGRPPLRVARLNSSRGGAGNRIVPWGGQYDIYLFHRPAYGVCSGPTSTGSAGAMNSPTGQVQRSQEWRTLVCRPCL